jgi:hypothetical protein
MSAKKAKGKKSAPPADNTDAIDADADTTNQIAVIPPPNPPNQTNAIMRSIDALGNRIERLIRVNFERGLSFTDNVWAVAIVSLACFGMIGLVVLDRYNSRYYEYYKVEQQRRWDLLSNFSASDVIAFLNAEHALMPPKMGHMEFIGYACVAAAAIYATHQGYIPLRLLKDKTLQLVDAGLTKLKDFQAARQQRKADELKAAEEKQKADEEKQKAADETKKADDERKAEEEAKKAAAPRSEIPDVEFYTAPPP